MTTKGKDIIFSKLCRPDMNFFLVLGHFGWNDDVQKEPLLRQDNPPSFHCSILPHAVTLLIVIVTVESG